MLQVLNVTMHEPGMAEMVLRRQQISTSITTEPPGTLNYRVERLHCLKVTSDRNGHLTCSLWQDLREMNTVRLNLQDQILTKLKDSNADPAASGTCHVKPCMIYLQDKIVAVGCSELQEGDYITANEYVISNHFLVLRPVNDDSFKILGQGFMLPGVEACLYDERSPRDDLKDLSACTCDTEHNVLRTWFEVDISDEDAVVLAGQDLLPGQRLEYDVDARFARLATRVSERGNRMVHIVPFDPMEVIAAEREQR